MAEPELTKKKMIIDTDPGIDDAMAIFVALRSAEVDVIGVTTIFGNVHTALATTNALHLLEVAERTDIPVAEGSQVTITEDAKLGIADFVHGADGLGNQNYPRPKGTPAGQSAAAFLVEQATKYPGQVTLVALGPLTNVALAIQLDPAFTKKIGKIVILGGAFAVNGNVNPAAEANISGDPDAADIVLTSGADILAVGINVTHQMQIGKSWQHQVENWLNTYPRSSMCIIVTTMMPTILRGIYLHDPAAMIAAIDPSVVTWTEGVVRVQKVGIMRGLTLLYNNQKRFAEVTEWNDKPSVKVAVTVDAPKVVTMVMDRLMSS